MVGGTRPSGAADLHALGLVLAEILAGDPPPSPRRVFGRGGARLWIGARRARRRERAVGGASVALDRHPSRGSRGAPAARRLGLVPSDAEVLASRRARVRRAYLAVRGNELRPGRTIPSSIDGPAAEWLRASLAFAERFAQGGARHDLALEPLDVFGTARWIVALVGPQAASWSLPAMGEGELAARLLELCAVAPPEAWTREDLTQGARGATTPDARRDATRSTLDLASVDAARRGEDGRDDRRWVEWTRALLASRPDEATLARVEDASSDPAAPPSLALDLASALLRRGDIGRAFAVLAAVEEPSEEACVLLAEIARRRGDKDAAATFARRGTSSSDPSVRDRARAILARLAWDRGALDDAEAALGDARGAFAAEVRGLVAYARADLERGLRLVTEAARDPHDALDAARLEATRGMLEHARGHAAASLSAYAWAADVATREGAVVEEAAYLTGLAAAAVDAGAFERALSSSTRASLLWERLGQPSLAARALLSRAAAFGLVGATHESARTASLAGERARASGDARAAVFARWAFVESRPVGDAHARAEALAADAELARLDDRMSEDRVRSAARLALWADGAGVSTEAVDRASSTCSPPARWEWWGARAEALLRTCANDPSRAGDPNVRADGARVLAALVALLDAPAPVASRGPALLSGARLATELGDGDLARRLETSRRALVDAFAPHVPVEHRAALASVVWANVDADRLASPSLSFDAAQIEQLESIVRALSSRDRLKPLLEQILDTMILWTGVERGLLLLRAPEGHLVPRAARNLRRQDLVGEQRALSMGIAKRAMDERKAVIATDAFAQVGDLHASVHALRLRSVLAVPLVARGEALGVVYLDDRVRRGAFGPKELAWVDLVATQAALAVADARDQVLLRRAVRRAERASARLGAALEERETELASVRTELAQAGQTRFSYDEIAGRSEPIRTMLKLVDRVTASDVPVLLVGESGTGKELVARAIHRNGARGSRPFVSENCAAVPETLLESTLFGHVRGAFTGASQARAGLFEIADGGTLFLDEIGEMPLSMQTKLLRVLQTGEVRPVGGDRTRHVDVRIVGATHRDLAAMVAQRTFREDLFYRLNVVSIRVPPLRERASDIPALVAHVLEKHAPERRIKVTRAAMDRLTSFPWPGNVRQLENELRRALVLAEDRIDLSELSEELLRGDGSASRDAGIGLKARVDALERQLVHEALERTKGNQTRAAEALGLSRYGLQKMMQRLGIRVP